MRVYRVEHGQTRLGPYDPDTSPIPQSEMDTGPTHPSPVYDLDIRALSRSMHFGFLDTAQLWSWFSSYCQYLRGQGYVVAQYEVPNEAVIVGGHQVAFNKERATRVGEETL